MENNILRSSVSLLVLCVVCGFSIYFSRHSKLQLLLNVFCCVVTVLCLVMWLTLLFMKLHLFNYSFIAVITLSLYILGTTNVTYYRIKFCLCQDLSSDIFGNIIRVDDLLKSLHISVPHTYNIIECVLFTIMCISLTALFNYQNFYYVYFSKTMLTDVNGVYHPISFLTAHLSIKTLTIFWYFIMRIIQQRVNLIYSAVEELERLSESNTAWCHHQLTVSFGQYRWHNDFIKEMHNNYATIHSIQQCIFEVFNTVRELYAEYFLTHTFGIIGIYSIHLFYNTTDKSESTFFILITVICFITDILPIFICESITSELQCLYLFINRLYYKRGLKNLQNDMKNWIHHFGYQEKKYDCGFFNIDISFLYILFNCITLLLLAMLDYSNKNQYN